METIRNLVDIIFKGVIATAVSVFVAYSTWQKNETDQIRQCDDGYGALVDLARTLDATDDLRQSLTFRINNYNTMCDALDPKQVGFLLNLMKPLAAPPPPVGQQTTTLSGWVALSRKPVKEYSDINFEKLDGSTIFAIGDQIKARWSVNVRRSNTPVSRGDNPVIGIVPAGNCVKVDQLESGQLNEWAFVKRVDCN